MASDGVKFLLSACGCPVFPAALTEEDALSPMCSLLKNKPTNLCKRKQLGFYSVPLVYMEYRITAFWCPGCSGSLVYRAVSFSSSSPSVCVLLPVVSTCCQPTPSRLHLSVSLFFPNEWVAALIMLGPFQSALCLCHFSAICT